MLRRADFIEKIATHLYGESFEEVCVATRVVGSLGRLLYIARPDIVLVDSKYEWWAARHFQRLAAKVTGKADCPHPNCRA